MTTYSLIDGRRISRREYRRMRPNLPTFLAIAVPKWFFPLGRDAPVPFIDRFRELGRDELPDEASAALAAPVAGCA